MDFEHKTHTQHNVPWGEWDGRSTRREWTCSWVIFLFPFFCSFFSFSHCSAEENWSAERGKMKNYIASKMGSFAGESFIPFCRRRRCSCYRTTAADSCMNKKECNETTSSSSDNFNGRKKMVIDWAGALIITSGITAQHQHMRREERWLAIINWTLHIAELFPFPATKSTGFLVQRRTMNNEKFEFRSSRDFPSSSLVFLPFSPSAADICSEWWWWRFSWVLSLVWLAKLA